MSSNIEINGIDEAGRIGENILFTKASVDRDFEIHLFLTNLSYFNKLIPNKDDIKGYDAKTVIKYTRDIIDNEIFKVC